MAAMTRFDKIVLGLTAAFLVVTGGYFVSGQLGGGGVPGDRLKTGACGQRLLAGGGGRYPDSLLEGEVIDLNTASEADLTAAGIGGGSGPRPSGLPGEQAAPSKAWKSSLR